MKRVDPKKRGDPKPLPPPSRIDLTTAFRMFKARYSPDDAEWEFRDAFYGRKLPLWCDDYQVETVHALEFRIDAKTPCVTVWPMFQAWSKPPDAYRFETSREQVEQHLAADKLDVKEAIKREAFRRLRAGEPLRATILRGWALGTVGNGQRRVQRFPSAVVPSVRTIQTWLYDERGFSRPPRQGRPRK